jgi:hypothetical protein
MKLAASLLILLAGLLPAQTPAVFATGLLNPSKLTLTEGGNLLVTEAGAAPNSGRISVVDKSGVRKTLIDGLPSGLAAPDLAPDGTNGVLVQGNVVFILNGEGDGFRSGAKPNTIVPNPAAPSSPILSSLMKLTLTGSVDTAVGGFVMTAAHHAALADGNSVTLTDSTGGTTATLEMVTDFRDGVADPVTVWRNSHPYGLAALDTRPDKLYVADAGMNLVYEVTVSSGRSRVLTRFAPIPNPAGAAGPPVSEAVPDSIRPYGDQLLVTLLHGFPFPQGGSQVYLVDPATGVTAPFITNLTSAIDVAVVSQGVSRPVFFTLEYSTNLLAGAPGRVTRYDTAQGKIIADGLVGATNLAYDASSQTLYILSHGAGNILKMTGQ